MLFTIMIKAAGVKETSLLVTLLYFHNLFDYKSVISFERVI